MSVYFGRRSNRSGRVLRRALREADYQGRGINFGYGSEGSINRTHAIHRATNKRRALEIMQDYVPVPKLYGRGSVFVHDEEGKLLTPIIGRPDRHRGGKPLWLCRTVSDIQRATQRGATHFLEYIDGGREFRVHIAFGKSIKLAEKIGEVGLVKSFTNGCYFAYPEDFEHKRELRYIAKRAVECLELDFGAVDIIFKDGNFYVLEVNTAPNLTSESDTLNRYVRAFKENE